MIRVRKTPTEPAELAKDGYGCDAVRKAVLSDQDEKCYLCERKLVTDFQVEHLRSQKNSPNEVDQWDNLFIACGYCNPKKLDSFDDICNPEKTDIELEISQKVNFCENKAEFASKVNDAAHQKTITLLEHLYNGTNPRMRKYREERFWNAFVQQINQFQEALDRYMENGDNEAEIKQMLDIKAENLGFKYSILAEMPMLMDKFKDAVKWNRV